MKCISCGNYGLEGFVIDDNASDEEIARIGKIIAETEPGNGSGLIFKRNGEIVTELSLCQN